MTNSDDKDVVKPKGADDEVSIECTLAPDEERLSQEDDRTLKRLKLALSERQVRLTLEGQRLAEIDRVLFAIEGEPLVGYMLPPISYWSARSLALAASSGMAAGACRILKTWIEARNEILSVVTTGTHVRLLQTIT